MIKSVLTLAALSVVFTGCGGKGGDDTGATVDTSVTDTSSTTTDTGGTTTDTATATDTGDTDTTTTIEGAPSALVVAISPEDPAEG
jgi:hypothetical protein